MKLYLDACCLNRLTDDQSQLRIRKEAEAVELILGRIQAGEIQWISIDALADEIDRNPHVERRLENAALLAIASENVEVDDLIARCRSSDRRLRSLRRTALGVRGSGPGGHSSHD